MITPDSGSDPYDYKKDVTGGGFEAVQPFNVNMPKAVCAIEESMNEVCPHGFIMESNCIKCSRSWKKEENIFSDESLEKLKILAEDSNKFFSKKEEKK